MIKKITKIKNFGVFNNYRSHQKLPEFNKYNLIYGWNASGKTTISRLFRCFELKTIHNDFSHAEFQLETKKQTLNHNHLDLIPNIKVFNQDFINESIFTEEDNSKINPVYYIGKEDITKKAELEDLKNKFKKIEEESDLKSTNLIIKKNEKEKLSTETAKTIKSILRTQGKDQYTNYNKANFNSRIKQLNETDLTVLSEDEFNNKKIAINQNVKNKLKLIETVNLFNENDLQEVNEVLQKEIISETLDKLKNDENLNEWVKEGLDLYEQSDNDICNFCEQSIPKKRIEDLKKHFNEDYKNLISKIEELEQDWRLKKISFQIPNKDSLYDHLSSNFETEQEILDEENKNYSNFITSILDKLKKKRGNPFEKITEVKQKSFTIQNSIKKINDIISKHNKKTEYFNHQKLKEKKVLEEHFLSEVHKKYRSLEVEINDLEKSAQEFQDKKSEIAKKISQLFQTKRDYRVVASEINKKLKAFLGREDLIFEATEDEGYYIKRSSNNEHAKHLSEGEKTAIALIYFLIKLKEENFDLKNGIVVIDDPVSSLDSNSILQALGFIQEEIKQADQVFILTHNFDFFKHVKHWLNRKDRHKEKENKTAEFFMIKNYYEEGERIAELSPLDKLLKQHDSEYQYLFKLLYNAKDEETFEKAFHLPNVARKFMETFLPFKFPDARYQEEFFSKARKKTKFDQGKTDKIIRFINAYSHTDPSKMTSWDISQWSESKPIIQDIFNLVEKLDEEHYKGLCNISQKEPEETQKQKYPY